jgi:hypothetical protein
VVDPVDGVGIVVGGEAQVVSNAKLKSTPRFSLRKGRSLNAN